VTAQEFHTEFISASVLYDSGSTRFGDTTDDTHAFTGSLTTSGSSLKIDSAGGYSGSVTSTGSFGRVEATNYSGDGSALTGIDIPTAAAISGSFEGGGSTKISGSSTSTGSFGRVEATRLSGDGADITGLSSFAGAAGTEALISGSSTSTGSFGHRYYAGNVGIGTTSPETLLDINYGANNDPLQLDTDTGNHNRILYSKAGTIIWRVGSAATTNNFVFADVDGNQKMAIDTSGNVGIGTASPPTQLMVNNDVAGTNTSGIGIGKIESGAGAWIDVDEELGRLSWYASYSSGNTTGIGAYISAAADANWDGTETPSRITFATAPESSVTPVERMRIDMDGKVQLGGKLTDAGAIAANAKVHVVGSPLAVGHTTTGAGAAIYLISD
ncbi:MAG: hypothetical protein QF535_07485, partial [Anaerolineales bacterium]|nr:hypothetical protein [Anaerolineales bacterium]